MINKILVNLLNENASEASKTVIYRGGGTFKNLVGTVIII